MYRVAGRHGLVTPLPRSIPSWAALQPRSTRDTGDFAPGALPTLGTILEPEAGMLYTIALILLVLWAVGLVGAYTMGGFIHLLLVAAIVLVLVRVIQGRRVL
jgi:hypothetical protein